VTQYAATNALWPFVIIAACTMTAASRRGRSLCPTRDKFQTFAKIPIDDLDGCRKPAARPSSACHAPARDPRMTTMRARDPICSVPHGLLSAPTTGIDVSAAPAAFDRNADGVFA